MKNTLLTIIQKLKISYLIIGIVIFIGTSCNEKKSKTCKIEGHLTTETISKLTLYKKSYRHLTPIDTVIAETGSFKFKELELKSPEMLYLQVWGQKNLIQLFAENSDIKIVIDINDLEKSQIQGSATHLEYTNFLDNNKSYINKLQDLYKQQNITLINKDEKIFYELDSLKQLLQKEHEAFLLKYVLENNNSHVATYIAYENIAKYASLETLKSIRNNFSNNVKSSIYYKKLEALIAAKENLYNQKTDEFLAELLPENFTPATKYIRVFFPFPDKYHINKLAKQARQTPKLYRDSDIATIIIIPDSISIANNNIFAVKKTTAKKYNKLCEKYMVNYAYKNFLIEKDSIILKSGKTPNETNLFIQKLKQKN